MLIGLGGCSESKVQHYVKQKAPKISACLKGSRINTHLRVNISELRKISYLCIGKELSNRLKASSFFPCSLEVPEVRYVLSGNSNIRRGYIESGSERVGYV